MVVIFLGSCTTLQNMTKIVKPSPRAANTRTANIEFLENLSVTPGKVYINNASIGIEEIDPLDSKPLDKMPDNLSDIEKSNWLQLKYSILVDVPVESITNITLLKKIDEWIGTPYVYGGSTKNGVDCSYFALDVMQVTFNKKLNRFQQSDSYIRTELLEFVDLGNGHLSQRLQRTFGLNVERVPKPFLDIDNNPKKNKIGLHFSTGPSAFDLLEKGFKEPRQLQQNTKIEIEKFINNSNYEFVEFGGKQVFDNEKIKNFTGTSIEDSIKELSECEFFIGLNSGFMSLAAAMSIKSIIIVNAPEVHNLYLPVIKDYWEDDMNWLYPQNVHLHQNGENELVKSATQFNIEKAINGEVYPFWNNELLDLIFI